MEAQAPQVLMKILVAGGTILLSLGVGLLLHRLLTGRARRLAQKTASAWDDLLVESLRGFVIVWSLLAGLSVVLKEVTLQPELLRILERFIGVAAIFSAVLFAVRLAKRAIYVYVDRITGIPSSILKNFATVVIYLLGFLVILDDLGVKITPLITAFGVGGLAVALALQDTLSNLFSGLNILMTKKIRPGDYIQTDAGQEGTVTDITWRNTTVKGLDNNLIIIPNSKLGQAVITNVHLPEREMVIFFPVTVAFTNDLRTVERITVEVAREILAGCDGAVSGFEPFIRFNAFTELGVRFNVILKIREFTDQYPVKHAFFLRLHERYRQEGVGFPVPARVVTIERE